MEDQHKKQGYLQNSTYSNHPQNNNNNNNYDVSYDNPTEAYHPQMNRDRHEEFVNIELY